jgi:hypothetical protein
MAMDWEYVRRDGSPLRVERRLGLVHDRRRLVIALALLLAGCTSPATPTTTASGGEAMHYRLSLDTVQRGPILVEGDTAFVNDQFMFSRTYFGGWIQMNGKLVGKAMKVTGYYGGSNMSGEGTVHDNVFVVALDTTGDLTSAVITLSVPPSVAARLAASQLKVETRHLSSGQA